MTLDVHNVAAFENAFRCPSTNLEAIPIFVEHFAGLLRYEKVAVVSPDIGGAKRAEQFRRALAAELHDEPGAAFVEKRRSGGVVTGDLLVGEVRDRAVIIFDDLISTSTTLRRAAARLAQRGFSQRRRTVSSWGRQLPSSPILCSRASQSPTRSVRSPPQRGGCHKASATSARPGSSPMQS